MLGTLADEGQLQISFQVVDDGFQATFGMPGVVEAVDGTNIPVSGPNSELRASYINKKDFLVSICRYMTF